MVFNPPQPPAPQPPAPQPPAPQPPAPQPAPAQQPVTDQQPAPNSPQPPAQQAAPGHQPATDQQPAPNAAALPTGRRTRRIFSLDGVIAEYDAVVQLVNSGLSKSAALEQIHISRSHFSRKRCIAEAAKVDLPGVQHALLQLRDVRLPSVYTFANEICNQSPQNHPIHLMYVDYVVAAIIKLAVTAVNKEQLTGTDATISCIVSGLTQVLDEVKWTLSDGTAIISGQDGYTIFTGEDSFSGDTQITTLAVTAAQTNVDNTYECLISSTELAETDKTVISTPKSVTTDTAQTLTCTIGDLNANEAVTVTWKEPGDGAEIINSDNTNYVSIPGTVAVDGSTGIQNAQLTIKQAKMAAYAEETSFTYKCSVTSSQYSDSPSSAYQDVVANVVVEKEIAVQPVHKEQLKGTQAMVSCVITGLTEALDKVEWRKKVDDSIIQVDNGDGFSIDTGTYDTGTQTTTLTVPDSQTNEDKIYKCIITPKGADGATEMITEVNLNVFTLSSTTKSVTTDADQTLTCTIEDLDANQAAVAVTWKDPNEAEVADSDTTNYVLIPGTVDGEGIQNAQLTIKQAKMAAYAEETSFTYKCSVTSSQYSDSPSSAYQDVVANVVVEKEIAVQPVHKEQLKGTQAMVSCVITGLTEALDKVEWRKKVDDSIIQADNGDGFSIDTGTYDTGTQTTTLTVPDSQTNEDKIYKCIITPKGADGATEMITEVNLNVFTLSSTTKSVTTDADQTLTCTIEDLDANQAAVAVTWKDPNEAEVADSDTTNYVLIPGTVDGEGIQNAQLTIKQAKMAAYAEETSFTYKCSVTSSQYSDSPSSAYQDVVANVVVEKEIAVQPVHKEQLKGTQAMVSCVITGLTEALDKVEWRKKVDDSIIQADNGDGFSIDTGTYDTGTQTTTLTVPDSQTNEDKIYKCIITPKGADGATEMITEVNLNVFTLSSTTKSVTTDADQTLTCTIEDLDANQAAVAVTWKDPNEAEVADSDTTNYVLIPGTVDGEGIQNAQLTIKQAKMAAYAEETSFTYKCSVTSSQYSDSPSSAYQDVVANVVVEKEIAVQPVHKEQLKGTQAMVSCVITGLTEALDKVEWRKKVDDSIIQADNGDGFSIDTGTYDTGTQTTTLTVPDSQTNEDKIYKCIITPKGADGATEMITEVNLNVFTLSSTTKSVTTDADQTLTCTIEDLDANQAAVAVTWKDPNEAEVADSDTTNYVLIPGTVDGEGIQNAQLTIKQAKMAAYAEETSFTYKCSVTSSQYSDSPSSAYQDVVANVVVEKEIAVQPVHKEQLKGTQAMVSCVITGLTEALDKVEWRKKVDDSIIQADNGDGFSIDTGTYDTGTQTTTLTVPDSQTNEDKIYKCIITPKGADGATEMITEVNLNVFTLSSTTKSVTTDADQTLTCTIEDLDANQAAVAVTWKDPNEAEVADSDTTNYVLIPGTVDGEGIQNAQLTIKQAKMAAYAEETSFTYKCSVTSSQYSDSPSSAYQDVVANVVVEKEIAVQPVHKEQLKGTQAMVSCVITGLTEALDKVEWRKKVDDSIIQADNGDGFSIDTGTYDTGTQTTTLTVPDSQTNEDKIYKCIITPKGADGATEMITEVNLNVFTLSSTTKSVTTDADQTLTCTIEDLDANQAAVAVTWKDPNEAEVADSDTTNYVLIPGTVDGEGIQNAQLTIKQAKMAAYAEETSFTYKCSVTSSQYSDSPSSAYQDVVANVVVEKEIGAFF
ncbi:uncharacterized protein LOC134823350 [Bolinopsis microptera]|uniref:uncharacterized protein LOC134823350 n=1 Tax=Bolinopsis microptera TaxID=2820187 RepID=UPI003078A66B